MVLTPQQNPIRRPPVNFAQQGKGHTMTAPNDPFDSKRLTDAYHRLLEKLGSSLQQAEKTAAPLVQKGLDSAAEQLSALGELTREELTRAGDYLKRDLVDAAAFLEKSGGELRDWLRFDAQVIEQSLLDLFGDVVDKTRVELEQFRQQANVNGEWHTGEVTGIGTLECKSCGEHVHFHKPGHIPPCPKCHGTTYRRVTSDE